MTTMLHTSGDPFDAELQLSQLRWVTSSEAGATGLAENYAGLPDRILRSTCPPSPAASSPATRPTASPSSLSDGPVPVSRELPDDGVAFHEVWNTTGAPAPLAAVEEIDPTERELAVPPPPLGTKIRINEFAPASSTSAGCSRRCTGPRRSTTASCSRARSR